ncbi:MAG: bifunctional riboflavin kinase/FAD synthetase [Blautia sp.]|nr:bifunctional riboflavin kinase/FAD synthetase [Blautia sp.]MCM1201886.1 bifunctional riboflavin kinase/FAD synthetase [Bacteroides fragilis]
MNMQIIQGTTDFALSQKSAVTIGKFDGLHLGHQKLFDRVLAQKEKGLSAVIFTFDPTPEAFFGGKAVKGLTDREEKLAAFEKMGIDVLIEFPLNKETAATEPEYFVREYLMNKLKAAVVIAGTDISFGSKGAGNAALLRALSKECGYRVEIIDKVSVDGEEVSSTLAREAVKTGDMKKAALLLGSPYPVRGTVAHGRKLGRKLGMPTVNLLPSGEKLLPPNGVYYSYVWFRGTRYPAISNVGYKPTVSDVQVIGVETYLYDFTEEIYGREIIVELLDFKRAEMKFDGVDALREQMSRDIADGRRFHGLPVVSAV